MCRDVTGTSAEHRLEYLALDWQMFYFGTMFSLRGPARSRAGGGTAGVSTWLNAPSRRDGDTKAAADKLQQLGAGRQKERDLKQKPKQAEVK